MKKTNKDKSVIALGDKMDRKALNRAKKNFEKSKGVPYDLRVKNLNSGDSEW